ncbi:hypothetical protein HDU83_002971 [Entophlyctis luteolus]|nr:hypothetical protein HDU82_006671 [Entophlyctis luteolus]KAJ3357843.1 hypothetical protein HDU83_002971 [Entophlyctis luteolus]
MILDEPLPLPDYIFDPQLTEDENFLIWCTILCRHSYSRKGHMAAIIVAPEQDPTSPRAAAEPLLSSSPQPNPRARIITYANNTPIMYNPVEKKCPEIHAEALCICRVAANRNKGTTSAANKSIVGATCYITAPPCTECFQLLAAAGIKRIVHLSLLRHEASLVAARVCGIDVVGVPFVGRQQRVQQELGDLPPPDLTAVMGSTDKTAADTPATAQQLRAVDQERAAQFWREQGETAEKTRERVDAWWRRWNAIHQEAAQAIGSLDGSGSINVKNSDNGAGRKKRKVDVADEK